jgi:hypothetical protein
MNIVLKYIFFDKKNNYVLKKTVGKEKTELQEIEDIQNLIINIKSIYNSFNINNDLQKILNILGNFFEYKINKKGLSEKELEKNILLKMLNILTIL